MEVKLSNWFDLAKIWGAVLLIDEADIYLETRTTSDLQRNSLVLGKHFIGDCKYYPDSLSSISPSHGVLPRHTVSHDKQSWSH